MTALELKNSLHRIVDDTTDDETLLRFYTLLSHLRQLPGGTLWNRLSEEEKEELLQSDLESDNPDNLISHADISAKHGKWL